MNAITQAYVSEQRVPCEYYAPFNNNQDSIKDSGKLTFNLLDNLKRDVCFVVESSAMCTIRYSVNGAFMQEICRIL